MAGEKQRGVGYTLLFAAIVCGVCSVVVSTSAVVLKPRQEQNLRLDRMMKVLSVAGLLPAGRRLPRAEVEALFARDIVAEVVTLPSGEVATVVPAEDIDLARAPADSGQSRPAPPNSAGIVRIEDRAVVYRVRSAGGSIILPIRGKGLWSTLRGYLALAPDTTTVRGITFYEHGETPGLGGEIENPDWQASWIGRQALSPSFEPAIVVTKGRARPAAEASSEVDGISGATLTCRGVMALVRFWLGADGFGPYLARIRNGEGTP
jgi:Na+-transporting NADH:ubiquinone oxidoreductase subunit C